MTVLRYGRQLLTLCSLLLAISIFECKRPEEVPGIYSGRFYWQDGLKDVSATLESDQHLHLDVNNREIREGIRSMIQGAISQSNVRTARGTFRASIVGFSPMLVSLRSFEIQSPNFSELLAYVESGNTDQVKKFVELNHNVNQRALGRTALYHAAASSKPKVVRALLELGSDPNIADFEGDTPLITAVTADSAEVARELIGSGANINQANQVGTTPVMRAVELRRLKLLTLLLQSGANPNYSSQTGKTALKIALDRKDRAAVAILKKFGATNLCCFGQGRG